MENSINLTELFKDSDSHTNTLLLKKLVAVGYYGNLQINGQLPNASYCLKDYLFSSGNFIVDFSALDAGSRRQFEKWLFDPHMNDAYESCRQNVLASDFRGYTSENRLNWWGRLLNMLLYRLPSLNWSITPFALSIDTKLRNIYCCFGENGFLVGFDFLNLSHLLDFQSNADSERIHNQANSKRIVLTKEIVRTLIQTDIKKMDPNGMLESMHPLSISVPEKALSERQNAMDEYRYTNLFEHEHRWYQRLWEWIQSLYTRLVPEKIKKALPMNSIGEVPNTDVKYPTAQFNISALDASEEKKFGLSIYYDSASGKIRVIEECEPIDSAVYGGGGGKIFAHVGAKSAMEECGINCKMFAGSSAGAIMALLSYLGYSADQCHDFFQSVNKDVLVYYDIDWHGLSDTRALKTALDYVINKKVLEIIDKYHLMHDVEGRYFLENEILPNGIITFLSLHKLKRKFPDCSLGEDLKVTATNKTTSKTVLFCFDMTPDMEVSEAIKISASMPPVYKHTLVNGEPHTDGGAKRNFLIEVFRDRRNTLLSSRYGTHLGTIGFCFDSGVELALMSNFRAPVYRESIWLNLMYSILTGVKDPASGWQQDRNKIIQNSHHVVILPANISPTQFSVLPVKQQELLHSGFRATIEYLMPLLDFKTGLLDRHMHAVFSTLEELMVQCALRGKIDLFKVLKPFALKHGVTQTRLEALENSHLFTVPLPETPMVRLEQKEGYIDAMSILKNKRHSATFNCRNALSHMRIFDALYPIFLSIQQNIFTTEQDYNVFKKARHFLHPVNYEKALNELSALKGPQHLITHIIMRIIKDSSSAQLEQLCTQLQVIRKVVETSSSVLSKSIWFYEWKLKEFEMDTVIELLKNNQFGQCFNWMRVHQRQHILMQLQKDYSVTQRSSHEGVDNEGLESNQKSFNV